MFEINATFNYKFSSQKTEISNITDSDFLMFFHVVVVFWGHQFHNLIRIWLRVLCPPMVSFYAIVNKSCYHFNVALKAPILRPTLQNHWK